MPYSGEWTSAGPNAERSDIALSHVDAGSVHATGVSLRGYGHLRNGLPLQDAHAVGMVPDSPLLIALVADGSGRFSHSHWLSEVLVRMGWRKLATHLTGQSAIPKCPGELAQGLRDLSLSEGRRLCRYLAKERHLNQDHTIPVDEASLDMETVASQMSCTLQFAIVHAETLHYAWVDVAGDGSAYWRDRHGRIHVIQQGSDATGLNQWTPPLPRYNGDPLVRTGRLERGDMLFMVTDGIGEALLDGTTAESVAFSSRIQTRPTVFNIASFVSTIGLNDKDDKTLVLITTD